jgi:integrase/recombinase XerD
VEKPIPKMALTVIYSCGLRLSEGCNLKARNIDGDRRLIRIDDGKGGDDRIVPLPQRPLELLRSYWDLYRPKPHLFPGTHNPTQPIPDGSLQSVFKIALAQSKVIKKGSIHSLRHSYATHLLEKGVPLRVIQKILGHKSVRTTQIYTHLTEETVDSIYPTIDALMADL